MKQINDPKIEGIFGYMYGQPILNCGQYYKQDRLIFIKKQELKLSKNGDSFLYTWGYPGPDYNKYSFADYGKTWVFADKPLNRTIFQHIGE